MHLRTRKWKHEGSAKTRVDHKRRNSKKSHRAHGVKTTNSHTSSKKIKLLYTPPKKAVNAAHTAPKPIKNRELMYEVEDVVDARMGRFGPQYLVKWEGYPPSQNMWIDELPSFFKSKCLSLINNAKKKIVDDSSGSESDSGSSSGSESASSSDSESESASSSDSESESDTDSTASNSSDDDEGCGPTKRHCCRCCSK